MAMMMNIRSQANKQTIYKLAVVAFNVQHTAMPAYRSQHLKTRNCVSVVWAIYHHQTLLCCFNPTPELTSTNVLSDVQHLLSGIYSLGEYMKALATSIHMKMMYALRTEPGIKSEDNKFLCKVRNVKMTQWKWAQHWSHCIFTHMWMY